MQEAIREHRLIRKGSPDSYHFVADTGHLNVNAEDAGSGVAFVGAGYNSYTGRFVDEMSHYDYTNVVDMAASVNTAFWKGLGVESLLSDGARWVDGSTDAVPAHSGLLAETREATLGALGKILLERKPIQGIVQLANTPGAIAIDTGNALAGMDHSRAA